MPAKRVKRPKLERDRPDRKWPTLFGAAAGNGAAPAAETASAVGKEGERAALSDTVDLGYRVIDDYLKQGRQAAQAFGPSSWMRGAVTGSPAGSAEEIQQMAQRVMQYGWDFAGMWFEMWSKMGATGAWPMPPGGRGPGFPGAPPPNGAAAERGSDADASEPETVVVSVDSLQPTTTSAQLRPGPNGELTIHALRADGHDAAPIKKVSIERSEEDGGFLVKVVVPAKQAPGKYSAPIVDTATNLPRGTLLVRVKAKKR